MADFDRRALGRSLSRAADASVADVLAGRFPLDDHPIRRIALTGAPGSGKSTLAGALARHRLAENTDRRIGILAIDPTSRYSGGAVLGDRIRMDSDDLDARLFIRSLASRHTGEGLADNVAILLNILGAHGFDETITETVGVGQVDCAVRELADCVVLVVNPESGDSVQAMKAGIMETADLYVVNKADLPGADRAVAALKTLAGRWTTRGWEPPVLETSSTNPQSVAALSDAIDTHLAWRAEAFGASEIARTRRTYNLLALAQRRLREVLAHPETPGLSTSQVMARFARSFDELAKTAEATEQETVSSTTKPRSANA